jgi:hypothetical protein
MLRTRIIGTFISPIFSVIRNSDFVIFTPCQFYGEKIAGACPDFQMEILSVTVILAEPPVGASWLD